jgi:hypothetical protein
VERAASADGKQHLHVKPTAISVRRVPLFFMRIQDHLCFSLFSCVAFFPHVLPSQHHRRHHHYLTLRKWHVPLWSGKGGRQLRVRHTLPLFVLQLLRGHFITYLHVPPPCIYAVT